jgi:predicted TIM-barrel fold metal-dependent hydrolase
MRHDESLLPHSPDVLERETLDDGFSAGWGLHHQPSESYVLDCHTHMWTTNAAQMKRAIAEHFSRGAAMRLRRQVFLDGRPDRIAALSKISAKDDRIFWMVWPEYGEPDLKFFKKWSKQPGFIGLKLHNANVIRNAAAPDVWASKAWEEIFEYCGETGKPVLWHVTQRLTDCPYMGGGRNSYWKEGWPKGAKYTNHDLLDAFIDVVSRHKKTRFIGAHHLHIGPEKLGKLFDKHKNLYADLSCGNIVRVGDVMYETDRQRWRKYLLNYPERLMFGTDCILGTTVGQWLLWENLAAHIRFVHQLHLPKQLLENLTHQNFERVAEMEPAILNPAEWVGVRP